jgi:hypothetical protein
MAQPIIAPAAVALRNEHPAARVAGCTLLDVLTDRCLIQETWSLAVARALHVRFAALHPPY